MSSLATVEVLAHLPLPPPLAAQPCPGTTAVALQLPLLRRKHSASSAPAPRAHARG
eukprot:CAMPEP_0171981776 /NCGR_PEP_ID=MMETSP0993-20121228/267974_1 /TAXON_ID=483369 /ORGANISM="non described non described, Strain CCMP2098" /LENGTH=55 /DNA_ID=CAMNT_0012634261 /DNA_START=71 /DNA_END=235 /DNA_ORIENTATION=-